MRNIKESVKDAHNKTMLEQIELHLAPSGYTDHPKHGKIAIRNAGYSQKEIWDLAYKLMLITLSTKISHLREIDRQVKLMDKTIGEMMVERKKKWYLPLKAWRLTQHIRTVSAVRSTINDLRTVFGSIGPHVPDKFFSQERVGTV